MQKLKFVATFYTWLHGFGKKHHSYGYWLPWQVVLFYSGIYQCLYPLWAFALAVLSHAYWRMLLFR